MRRRRLLLDPNAEEEGLLSKTEEGANEEEAVFCAQMKKTPFFQVLDPNKEGLFLEERQMNKKAFWAGK